MSTSSTSVRDAALDYIGMGFKPIPVPHGQKRPVLEGWQHLDITPESAPEYFNGKRQNIGILLGTPSGDLVDGDLDTPEALALAHWLPQTGRASGHRSKPESHHYYRARGIATTRYKDTDGTTLCELRSDGAQTLVWPSIHPSGEPIVWERQGPAPWVEPTALATAFDWLAAGALVARHWPAEEGRHDAALALAGALLRAGWPEDEAATFVRDVARAAGDEEWAARGANVKTTARRLVNDKKATGLPTLAALLSDGAAVVEKLRDWLRLPRSDAAAFRLDQDHAPAAPATDWPAPLAAAAYHGLAGAIVRAQEPHTEADPAALLVNTLVMFGSAAGRGLHALVGDTRHGLNLFAVLVGETAKGRKGTSEDGPFRLVSAADLAWGARFLGGLSSGEGLIHAVRDPIEKQEAIKEKGQVTGYQTVVVDAGVDDKRLLASEQEFAATLKVAGREGNTLSPVMRQAWDGKPLRILTKNSPAVATAPHVSILAHCTIAELHRYLDATESANGYANRFLWVCVRRSKVLPEGGCADAEVLAELSRRLGEALAFARGCRELRRDPEARELWAEVYPDLSAGKPGLLGAVTARAEAQVLRLSLVYAVLDRSPVVRAEHLLAGLAVWDYCEASARYIFGDATGDPIADRILKHLRTVGPLAQGEIVDLFGRHVRGALLDRALETLSAARLVASEREETGGRPRTIWRAL